MVMSLSQPLLQNFGWQFATINVRLAESAQRSSQWSYASSVNDFVQRIGNDYWGVVQAEENLEVANSALKFNADLVRVNGNNVRLGMMAAVNLSEALSAAATARANVSAAKAGLVIARTTLRQDVALNRADAMLAAQIEPEQKPDIQPGSPVTDNVAFRQMLEDSPALAGMREAIRSALIQVKFAENQTLPQLNIGAQVRHHLKRRQLEMHHLRHRPGFRQLLQPRAGRLCRRGATTEPCFPSAATTGPR